MASESLSARLQRATDHHKQGRLPEAEALYFEILAREPKNFDALNRLGILKYQRGQAGEAHRLLSAAIALNPDSDTALSNHAAVLIALRRFEEALATCDRALALKPNDPDIVYNRGHALLELKRADEALICYDRVLTISPNDPQATKARANTLVQLGRPQEALACYESALTLNRNDADTWHNHAGVLVMLNRAEDAIASYQRALAIQPNHERALINLGNAFLSLRRSHEALACYERVLTLEPDNLEALANRGVVLQDLKRDPDSLASFERALAVAPNDPAVLFGRGSVLLRLSRLPEALDCFDRLLAILPEHAEALRRRGKILLDLGRFDEALATYDRALFSDPQHANTLSGRGFVLMQLRRLEDALADFEGALAVNATNVDAMFGKLIALIGKLEYEQALETCRRILSIEPRHIPARWIALVCMLPRTAVSQAAREAGRRAFADGLRDLIERLPDGLLAERAFDQMVPFLLAYYEEDNREVFARYGELRSRVAEQYRTVERRARPRRSPLRLGIVSAYVKTHSVWDALLKGIMQHLDKNRVEVDIFHLSLQGDAETDWAKSHAAHFEQGLGPPEDWANRILARQPDVLLYPEIGIHATAACLASRRLAELQVTMWGHPHTTGLRTIDCFFSADALEPADGEAHYTERLIRLPRLGCCYARSAVEPAAVDLAALGISTDAPLLLSPGTPFKYAPEHDWVFPEIAKRLGRCTIIFFADNSDLLRPHYDRLLRRVSSAFTAHGLNFSDYCVVLPWQAKAAFYGLMKRADVMLDTIGFSGFNTAMQAVECGLPIVTREGRLMRGRFASGILRRMELTELVAGDELHYVDIAVATASDRSRRDAVHLQIEQRRDVLFDDKETVYAFQDHLLKLTSERNKS